MFVTHVGQVDQHRGLSWTPSHRMYQIKTLFGEFVTHYSLNFDLRIILVDGLHLPQEERCIPLNPHIGEFSSVTFVVGQFDVLLKLRITKMFLLDVQVLNLLVTSLWNLKLIFSFFILTLHFELIVRQQEPTNKLPQCFILEFTILQHNTTKTILSGLSTHLGSTDEGTTLNSNSQSNLLR